MPQESKSAVDRSDAEARRGLVANAADPEALAKAIELAVDYRGDVTITRRSTGESVDCFIFDRRTSKPEGDAVIRALPKDDAARLEIPVADIERLEFTGRDTAAGKSFETWMKKYVQKKLAGEKASIESDPLEE